MPLWYPLRLLWATIISVFWIAWLLIFAALFVACLVVSTGTDNGLHHILPGLPAPIFRLVLALMLILMSDLTSEVFHAAGASIRSAFREY